MENKILAIRYIIYKVAKEYTILNNSDTSYFENNNNFNLEKCLLLPFIITIANGKKGELLKVFDKSFFPDVVNKRGVLIGKSEGNNFQIFNAKDLSLNFNQKGRLIFDFDKTEFQSIDTKTKDNIDYSINFIKEKRFEDFANFDFTTLSKISRENDAFEYLTERINTKEFEYKNNFELVDEFQKIIMEFPFYMSLIQEIEDDINKF